MARYSSAFAVYEAATDTTKAYTSTDEPIQIMSCTKSFASLAIGLLCDAGKLKLSDRLAKWIPNIQSDRITVEHVLTHRSGLNAKWNSGREHDSARDVYAYVLGLKMTSAPGEKILYNNNAVELLGLLVKIITGENLRDFLYSRLFKPLGIKKPVWYGDRAGNSYASWGLCLDYRDMLKVGKMLLSNGSGLISSKYIRKMASKSLLVWKHPLGYYFEGYMGNLLLIIPLRGRVIVRLVKTPSKYDNDIQVRQLAKVLKQPLFSLDKQIPSIMF